MKLSLVIIVLIYYRFLIVSTYADQKPQKNITEPIENLGKGSTSSTKSNSQLYTTSLPAKVDTSMVTKAVVTTKIMDPVPPSNLLCTERGENHVVLSWQSTTKESDDSYTVVINETEKANISNTQYKAEGLSPCTYYCFSVVKKTNHGQSNSSKWLCCSTKNSDLGVVKVNEVESKYSDAMRVSWTREVVDKCRVTYAVQYKLIDDGGKWTEVKSDDKTILLKTLSRSRTYQVKVQVRSFVETENGAKTGNDSNIVTFNTDIKPDKPSNISLLKRGKDFLNISWISPSENINHGPITYYTINSKDTDARNTSKKQEYFDNLKTCSHYCFKIAAYSNFGNSEFTDSQCFNTTAPNVGIVTVNKIDNSYTKSMLISWNYSGSDKCGIKYDIEYGPTDNSISISTKETGEKYFNLTNLVLSRKYRVRVKAKSLYNTENNIMDSVFSNDSEFITDKKPNIPSDVSLIKSTPRSLTVGWKTSGENVTFSVSSYNVLVDKKLVKKDFAANTATIYDLQPCKLYCVIISAQNKFWNSSFNRESCFNTTAPNLSVAHISPLNSEYSTERKISWQYNHTEKCKVGFIIEYKDKCEEKNWSKKTNDISPLSNDIDSILLKNLKLSHSYDVRIKAVSNHLTENIVMEGNYSYVNFFTGYEKAILTVSNPIYDYAKKHLEISWSENTTFEQNILGYIIILKNTSNTCMYELHMIKKKNSSCFPDKSNCAILRIENINDPLKNTQFTGLVPLSHVNYSIIMYAVNYAGNHTIYETNDGKIPKKQNSIAGYIVLVFFILLSVSMCCFIVVLLKRKGYFKLNERQLMTSNSTKVNGESESGFSDAPTLRNLIELKLPKELVARPISIDQTPRLSLSEILNNVTNTKQNIRTFAAYCEKMMLNQNESLIMEYKKLSAESENLERNLKLTKHIGKSPYNLKKNRFQNILPFDKNRVFLSGNTTDQSYINASLVPYSEDLNKIEFIAAQGPIETTVDSFILMIWEQKVNCIVMLTQTYEDGKFKCMQYWPEKVDEKLKFGPRKEIIVKLDSEKEETSHFERQFTFENTSTNEVRTVYHIHMHTWCDYSAPDSDSFYSALTRFHELMETTTSAPFLVHCSAGVGRTGTFICLDRIVRQLNKGAQQIDIYKTILELRAYRNFLVQRQAQYVFIHEFLHFFIDKYTFEKTSPTNHII